MHEKTERGLQQTSRCPRRFFFDNRNVAGFNAELFAEFAAREASFLPKTGHRFAKLKQLASDGVLGIGRHVSLMKSVEIVFHR